MARPARPWFRFYVEAVHDRKLRRLKPEHRWLFVACLAAARQSPEPGVLLVGEDDPMGWDDLCDFAAMPLRSVEKGVDALQAAGILGFDDERQAWFVPAWNDRQFESDDVTARTAKHRSRKRVGNVPTNVPTPFLGTAPETEAETETDVPPPPPAERGVHRGQHANCRACGTTRRAQTPKPPEPRCTVPDASPLLAELRNYANEAAPPGPHLARARQAITQRTEAS